MKKYIFILSLAAPLFFASCDYMSNFEGLDELTAATEAVTYEYTIADADFTTIAAELRKNRTQADSLAASALFSAKIFSFEYPAAQYVPYLLTTKYAGATKGSAAKITYGMNDTTIVGEENKYTLLDEDYNSMGTGTDTPGQYKNFSASVNPDFYIPVWLTLKYPYAKPGDAKLIRYMFHQSSATTQTAKVYVFNNDVWAPATKTEQFVFAGWDNGGWVFDPTIRVTMKKGKEPTDDYMLVVNYVKEHQAQTTPDLVNSYGDSEYYYGFAAYYGNISWRESDRLKDPDYVALGDDDAAKEAFCMQRTNEGLAVYLTLKFPDTPIQVSGLDVHCLVTTAIYDGTATTNYVYDMKRVDTELKWEFTGREKL